MRDNSSDTRKWSVRAHQTLQIVPSDGGTEDTNELQLNDGMDDGFIVVKRKTRKGNNG